MIAARFRGGGGPLFCTGANFNVIKEKHTFSNKCLLPTGAADGAGHVLLYAVTGGDGDLCCTRKWFWPERGNLSLQVTLIVSRKSRKPAHWN